jgi:NADP-dependent 3-hydroxy acid dehydrogenase YdfG
MAEDRIRGKVAVLTGASGGIGEETAVQLAARGARLALGARRRSELDETAAACRTLGADVLAFPTDVTDRAQAEGLVAAAAEQWGRVDIVIANAGQMFRIPVRDLTLDDVVAAMEVNYFGAVATVLAALPGMIERGEGHIVLLGSLESRKGVPHEGAYAATKFAIAGFGDVARQELREHGIAVTTAFFGRVDAEMIAPLRVSPIQPKIPAARAARAIVRGIDKRKAEVVVPAVRGRLFFLAAALSPRLADFVNRLIGASGTWEE